MRRESHVRFGGRAGETHRSKDGRALRSDPYTKLLGPTKWTYFYLYVVLDIFSRYAVGWMVADRENSALAACLIEQYFGQFSSSAIGDGSTVTKVLVLKG